MNTASVMYWAIYILYGANIVLAALNVNLPSLCGWLVATYWYWAYSNLFNDVDSYVKQVEKSAR